MDWLPEDHPAFFILDVVEQLDLRAITQVIQAKDPRGNRPYSPVMMVALLLYAYMTGVFSSRRIARACVENIAFRVVTGNQQPHNTRISEFRRMHLEALEGLFVQVLQLCQAAGLVKGQHVHQDGTTVQANASRHKAMSYERMVQTEARLTEEVRQLLDRAELIDQAEDAELGEGVDERDQIASEVKRRETRREWIRKTREALEEEARQSRAASLRARAAGHRQGAEEAGDDDKEHQRKEKLADKAEAQAAELVPEPPEVPEDPAERLPEHQVQTSADGMPKPKAQRNFTDPDSRIMKNKKGAFDQCFNGQVSVDEDTSVITAQALSNQAPDSQYLPPLVARTIANLGRAPDTYTADSGYFSADNVTTIEEAGSRPYIATGRERRVWPPPEPTEGAPPEGLAPKDKMAWRLRTEEGRLRMSKRKSTVEKVFGTIKEALGFRRFLLRGLHKARSEWALVCTAYNLKKLHKAMLHA